MTNVPFVALLLGAGWLWVRGARAQNGAALTTVAAGMLCATALALRPSEVYWIVPTVAAFVVVQLLRSAALPWRRLALLGIGGVCGLAPWLAVHVATFGWGFGGYGETLQQLGVVETHGLGDRLLGSLQPWLFPLGFAPRTAARHFLEYGVRFFWWWSAAVVVAGTAVAARIYKEALYKQGESLRRVARRHAAMVTGVAVMCVWLVLLYGSWSVQDNSAGDITIGVSYFRYWLPIFVLSTAPVALVVGWVVERWRGERARGVAGRRAWPMPLLVSLALCFTGVSTLTVLYSPAEGLVASHTALVRAAAAREFVVAHTPADAVVVVDRADKFVFPSRVVLQPLASAYTYRAICELYPRRQLYYYGITLPAGDLAYVRDVQLRACGLAFQPVAAFGNESLYRVVRADASAVAYE
jgi:hypothetical protein